MKYLYIIIQKQDLKHVSGETHKQYIKANLSSWVLQVMLWLFTLLTPVVINGIVFEQLTRKMGPGWSEIPASLNGFTSCGATCEANHIVDVKKGNS